MSRPTRSPIVIGFSTPVTIDEVLEHISLAPAAKGFKGGLLDAERRRYTATINLAVRTK